METVCGDRLTLGEIQTSSRACTVVWQSKAPQSSAQRCPFLQFPLTKNRSVGLCRPAGKTHQLLQVKPSFPQQARDPRTIPTTAPGGRPLSRASINLTSKCNTSMCWFLFRNSQHVLKWTLAWINSFKTANGSWIAWHRESILQETQFQPWFGMPMLPTGASQATAKKVNKIIRQIKDRRSIQSQNKIEIFKRSSIFGPSLNNRSSLNSPPHQQSCWHRGPPCNLQESRCCTWVEVGEAVKQVGGCCQKPSISDISAVFDVGMTWNDCPTAPQLLPNCKVSGAKGSPKGIFSCSSAMKQN